MRRTILFVDDDRDFLKAQEAFFSARGYEVLAADGPDAALTMIKDASPQVIVLDLMMDHFDSGFTLAHRLRQDPRLRAVPIIMLSGVASATGHRFEREIKPLAEWSKLDVFLDKPITGKQLERVIVEQMESAGQAAARGSEET